MLWTLCSSVKALGCPLKCLCEHVCVILFLFACVYVPFACPFYPSVLLYLSNGARSFSVHFARQEELTSRARGYVQSQEMRKNETNSSLLLKRSLFYMHFKVCWQIKEVHHCSELWFIAGLQHLCISPLQITGMISKACKVYCRLWRNRSPKKYSPYSMVIECMLVCAFQCICVWERGHMRVCMGVLVSLYEWVYVHLYMCVNMLICWQPLLIQFKCFNGLTYFKNPYYQSVFCITVSNDNK